MTPERTTASKDVFDQRVNSGPNGPADARLLERFQEELEAAFGTQPVSRAGEGAKFILGIQAAIDTASRLGMTYEDLEAKVHNCVEAAGLPWDESAVVLREQIVIFNEIRSVEHSISEDYQFMIQKTVMRLLELYDAGKLRDLDEIIFMLGSILNIEDTSLVQDLVNTALQSLGRDEEIDL